MHAATAAAAVASLAVASARVPNCEIGKGSRPHVLWPVSAQLLYEEMETHRRRIDGDAIGDESDENEADVASRNPASPLAELQGSRLRTALLVPRLERDGLLGSVDFGAASSRRTADAMADARQAMTRAAGKSVSATSKVVARSLFSVQALMPGRRASAAATSAAFGQRRALTSPTKKSPPPPPPRPARSPPPLLVGATAPAPPAPPAAVASTMEPQLAVSAHELARKDVPSDELHDDVAREAAPSGEKPLATEEDATAACDDAAREDEDETDEAESRAPPADAPQRAEVAIIRDATVEASPTRGRLRRPTGAAWTPTLPWHPLLGVVPDMVTFEVLEVIAVELRRPLPTEEDATSSGRLPLMRVQICRLGATLRPAPRSGPLSRELQLEVKLGTLSVREWLFREPDASPADASSSGGAADDPTTMNEHESWQQLWADGHELLSSGVATDGHVIDVAANYSPDGTTHLVREGATSTSLWDGAKPFTSLPRPTPSPERSSPVAIDADPSTPARAARKPSAARHDGSPAEADGPFARWSVDVRIDRLHVDVPVHVLQLLESWQRLRAPVEIIVGDDDDDEYRKWRGKTAEGAAALARARETAERRERERAAFGPASLLLVDELELLWRLCVSQQFKPTYFPTALGIPPLDDETDAAGVVGQADHAQLDRLASRAGMPSDSTDVAFARFLLKLMRAEFAVSVELAPIGARLGGSVPPADECEQPGAYETVMSLPELSVALVQRARAEAPAAIRANVNGLELQMPNSQQAASFVMELAMRHWLPLFRFPAAESVVAFR